MRDPNAGSNIGWVLLGGVILFGVLFALMAQNLCGKPEKWTNQGEEESSGGAAPTPPRGP